MEFETYRPKGGWLAHYRRKAIFEKVTSTVMALAAFFIYAAVVTFTETI